MSHLLCFGMGLSARTLTPRLKARGWTVTATSRSPEGLKAIESLGCHALHFGSGMRLPSGLTHILVSAPPDSEGDPVLRIAGDQLAMQSGIVWVGYLSTTGVYGDHGGDWVSEDTPLVPNTDRGHRRLDAEMAWLALPLPVHVFRLAGIYGPGRNQLLTVRNGTAKRIIKPGQVFSRIHVDDIAAVLEASIAKPNPGRAYNVCDDEPCPPQDVVAYAADLLGLPTPPEVPYSEAELSPMARSFYADSKRVTNQRIKQELGVRLTYPTYREGLQALALALRR